MIYLIILSFFLLFSNVALYLSMLYFRGKSMKDELTDLPNYRYLNLYLKKNLKRKKLRISILDINNFKEFNNINIHKGDEVLKEFSYQLKTLLTEDDIVCRYRLGDEFALVFHDKTKAEVIEEINNIIFYFNNYSFSCLAEMKDYRISFCYGVSDSENANTFFENAEEELAASKMEKY
ncbi:MAG: GGDEF domain-containing protein [Bacteroidales bacterium]